MQAKYGSVDGELFGYTKGQEVKVITLQSKEYITEARVGFQLYLHRRRASAKYMCNLKFGSNQRPYPAYDAGCASDPRSKMLLQAGLAYFSGHGNECIEGLTLHYFK